MDQLFRVHIHFTNGILFIVLWIHFLDCLDRFPLGETYTYIILKVFPGISPHLLVLEQMFWIPFFRDLWSTTGSVAATKVWQTIKADKLILVFVERSTFSKCFLFRRAWRVFCWRKQEDKLQFWCLGELLRL